MFINLATEGVQFERDCCTFFQNIHTWSLQIKVCISLIITYFKTDKFDTEVHKAMLLLGMMHISVLLLLISNNRLFLVSIKSKIHDCNSTVPMQFVSHNYWTCYHSFSVGTSFLLTIYWTVHIFTPAIWNVMKTCASSKVTTAKFWTVHNIQSTVKCSVPT